MTKARAHRSRPLPSASKRGSSSPPVGEAPAIDLPAEIVDQLVGFGMQTNLGHAVLQALLSTKPALKNAVNAQGGKFHVQVSPVSSAVLRAGHL